MFCCVAFCLPLCAFTLERLDAYIKLGSHDRLFGETAGFSTKPEARRGNFEKISPKKKKNFFSNQRLINADNVWRIMMKHTVSASHAYFSFSIPLCPKIKAANSGNAFICFRLISACISSWNARCRLISPAVCWRWVLKPRPIWKEERQKTKLGFFLSFFILYILPIFKMQGIDNERRNRKTKHDLLSFKKYSKGF